MSTTNLKELIDKVKHLKVLYVEDEQDVRDETTRFLKKFFPSLVIKNDGIEGFELLEGGETFDLIITDFKMPIMNGSEVMNKAKELKPDTITVLMSGISLDIDEKEEVESDYKLSKPVNFQEFVNFLEEKLLKDIQ